MDNYQDFNVQLQELNKDNLYDAPKDELNEYTDFEIGFKRFCFDNNRNVLIEIGDEKIILHLYHDILNALEDRWHEQITKLAIGNKVNITFGRDLDLTFHPIEDKDEVICEYTFLGTGKYKYCNFYLSQVVKIMNCFVNEVFEMAIQQGYITAEDFAEFTSVNKNNET
ncbi:hypothetical protein [Calothrix sp. CCY 0018]|uniref:hypothetical protein n=1 Tax=Calothrix sp. CCY 0018 TaxID=3103864 RepID=UPI0039C6FFC7